MWHLGRQSLDNRECQEVTLVGDRPEWVNFLVTHREDNNEVGRLVQGGQKVPKGPTLAKDTQIIKVSKGLKGEGLKSIYRSKAGKGKLGLRLAKST